MSFEAMTWAIRKELPTNQKMVLLMLADRTNGDTGRCDPSHQRLAQDCGMSLSTVKRVISQLEEAGLLSVETRSMGGVSLPNQYQLKMNGVGSQRPHPGSHRTDGSVHSDLGVGSQRATNQEYNQEDKPKEQKGTGVPEQAPKVKGKGNGQVAKFDPLSAKPENVSSEVWAGFCEMRAKMPKGAQLTARACANIATTLKGHENADAIVDLSTTNGWRNVFPNSRSLNPNHHDANARKSSYVNLPVHHAEEDDDGRF